jgi:hypothetical protein
MVITSPEVADISFSCSCSSKGIAGSEIFSESQPFKKADAAMPIKKSMREKW